MCPREVFFVEFDTLISLLYHFALKLNDQFMHSRRNVPMADGPKVRDTLSRLGSVTHYTAEWLIFGLCVPCITWSRWGFDLHSGDT